MPDKRWRCLAVEIVLGFGQARVACWSTRPDRAVGANVQDSASLSGGRSFVVKMRYNFEDMMIYNIQPSWTAPGVVQLASREFAHCEKSGLPDVDTGSPGTPG